MSTSSAPVISGSTEIPPYGSGYAIYVPMKRNDRLWGFLAGEFLYSRVISNLVDTEEGLRQDYLCRVEIAGNVIYDNTFIAGSIDEVLNDRGGISVVFPIFERRIRFTVVRTAEAFTRDRRNLP